MTDKSYNDNREAVKAIKKIFTPIEDALVTRDASGLREWKKDTWGDKKE